MTDDLLDAGAGSSVVVTLPEGETHLDVVDVDHDAPTSANGSAIPGRRALVCEAADGTRWRVTLVYEYEGVRDRVVLRTTVQRAVEDTLTGGVAWDTVGADVARADADARGDARGEAA
jgi:hypothetical protein